ncbi:hypothetical protein D3C85_1405730 [compost metagenome]
MNEVREVRLLQLRVLSQNVVQKIVELGLLLLFTEEVLNQAFGSVLKVGIKRRIQWREVSQREL